MIQKSTVIIAVYGGYFKEFVDIYYSDCMPKFSCHPLPSRLMRLCSLDLVRPHSWPFSRLWCSEAVFHLLSHIDDKIRFYCGLTVPNTPLKHQFVVGFSRLWAQGHPHINCFTLVLNKKSKYEKKSSSMRHPMDFEWTWLNTFIRFYRLAGWLSALRFSNVCSVYLDICGIMLGEVLNVEFVYFHRCIFNV